jgi:dTDP-4-dehydrorhamnose reductase
MKVAVFGATGMLGHAMHNVLGLAGLEVISVGRAGCDIDFSVGKNRLSDLDLTGVTYIVNCIGVITHLIDEDDESDRARAASVNAIFPFELAAYSEEKGMRVIQIATDCVYSGTSGGYVEASKHDASDTYGITKSVGEVKSPNVMILRASIIGREVHGFRSLMEWVLRQQKDAKIDGYVDRLWNGVTTLAFSRIARGIIQKGLFSNTPQHIVPSNSISKAELVKAIAEAFGRSDITVTDKISPSPKNLTLSTSNPDRNAQLWSAAGYSKVPSIQQMLDELAR